MTQYRKLATSLSLVLLVLLLSLISLASPAQSSQPVIFPPGLSQLPSLQTQPLDEPLEVSITEEGMFPPVLWITPGTVIRWTNQTSQTQRLEGIKTAFVPDADTDADSGGPITLYLPLIFKGNNDSQSDSQAGNNPVSPDTTWQSSDLLPGESFERAFDESGAYPYHLASSTALSGTVIIPGKELISNLAILPMLVAITTDDNTINGNCTLREAIIAANKNMAVDACPAGSGADTILLSSGIYALTVTGSGEDATFKGDLDITKYSDVTIVGANDGSTIIDAGRLSDRAFHVLSGGKLKLSNVTIKGGTGYGGGIYNVGTLTLENSSVLSNTASGSFGGGLKNEGTATVKGSTFSGNSADYGGGIYNRGILTLNNSTISGNTARKYGGGLKNEGTLKLNNVTISANTANDKGGGVLNYNYGKTYLRNTILAGNTAPNATRSDCDYLSTGSQSFYSYGYNLFGDNTGCPTAPDNTDLKIDPAQILSTVLGPLQNNGGNTFTHALLSGSSAIDAGNPNGCKDSSGNLLTTDQRGQPRPVDGNNDTITRCDIGAYEAEPANPAQTSPYIINIAADTDDGLCTLADCSLREAVLAANAKPNKDSSTPDEIRFNIPISGVQTILLTSTLTITDPLIIDGTTQPGASCESSNLLIKLDGTNAGPAADGLNITAGGTTIRGLIISGFSGDGIEISGNGNNIIRCNTITANGGDGVRVTSSAGNAIDGTGLPADVNRIFDNTGLGIDLGGDGVTLNDLNDADTAGPNNGQNFPVLTRAIPNGSGTNLEGRLNSSANTTFNLEFFTDETCDPASYGEGETFLGAISATTNISGNVSFSTSFTSTIPEGQFIAATVTDPGGNTSEFSQCVQVNRDNDTWPRALRLDGVLSADQYLDKLGQSRWYKFTVTPNSRVIVTLTNLPANYDLTIYKDIAAAFNSDLAELNQPQDLLRLGAEFAAGARSPDEFAAGARSPDAFAAGARSPDAFAVANFSPDVFAAGARSPDAFAAGARSPDALAAGARSPDVFAPDAFAPDAFAAGARSEDDIAAGARSEDFYQAFASAQIRSLIGFSAFEGTTSEGIILNTWNNSGDFYVRVRGRDGAFSQAQKFHLEVQLSGNVCSNVSAAGLPATSLTAAGNNYQTLILADLTRLPDTPMQELETFRNRAEVRGVLVNVGADARVAAANQLADSNPSCPYAKNLVAEAIKAVVDRYRAANPLAYIVIVGNDNVIPFFRYPDSADLGPESDYVPPVFDFTTSQASLKLNYVLSQDFYGSKIDLAFNVNQFPVPDLPVGRLVETPGDIIRVLEAYAQTNGVVRSSSALVTGYDFFADAAEGIEAQLEAGLEEGTQANTLIAPREASPLDPRSWTADQLRSQLLDTRHDLIFLGGHFSAASALAADYQTRLVSSDLTSSSVNLENAVIFSIGCHSGYNIVNEHGIPFITREPDWAQAFAQKGATLIAGTGYQYGDTDFIEYSERIYLEFARQLRTGTEPVAVGEALVKSKQRYLAETPEIRGLHEKSLLISTIFGLPMLKVDMPRRQAGSGGLASTGGTVETAAQNPGARLGLATANISVDTNVSSSPVTLKNVENPASSVEFTVLKSQSPDGVNRSLTNAGEPVLPLWLANVPGAGSRVLRGVGFRGGDYSDNGGVRPLTGAPTTEIRGVHTAFFSDVFFPIQPWRVNYFDALTGVSGGATTLALMPAQFRTDDPGDGTNILRQFSKMQFRLYYSDNTSSSALAAAPAIVGISAMPDGNNVNFRVNVIGDPTAGIQEVWVTYTTIGGSRWQPLDLAQDANDSTLWTGTLLLSGTAPENVRYMVQAANGVGLVSLATNVGAYYIPGVTPGAGDPTSLSLGLPASSGVYGSQASFSAVLSSNGTPLAGRLVTIGLGSQSRQAVTDNNGRIAVTLPLLALPGQNTVRAAFAGTADNAPSSDTATFNITKQNTVLTLNPQPASGPASKNILLTANLTDAAGQRLFEKTIFFEVSGASGTYRESVITDFAGRAPLGNLPLPPGTYTVKAYFNGTISVSDIENVTLDDARYNPAPVAIGELTLTMPTAQDDTYSVDEDNVLNVAAPGVLGNDTNDDFPSLTAILVSSPANGTLTLNANGSFIYTPNANFYGNDSFTYRANDGSSDSNVATVNITVNPVNDAPVAVNDAYSVDEDSTLNVPAPGVLGNDTDVDGDLLTAVLVSGPANGSLTLNTNGSFSYTPNANFYGNDSFTYRANDGSSDSNVATVNITVNSVNDAPVAMPDSYSVDQNKILTVPAPGVLGNDIDVDGAALSAVLVAGPSNGVLTLNPNGSFTYTPNSNFSGTDTFTYQANDGAANSNIATVTITVKKLNICSTATSDPVTIWPPNKDLLVLDKVNISGAAAITITAIFQDESVGSGKYSPDGFILGSNKVKLRAERDGKGNGRVYHIYFTAVDAQGGFCSGEVRSAIVPHDQSGTIDQIDGGALCDSTKSGCVPLPPSP